MAVEYRILGPLELRTDGRPLELTGSRQRALLTILLLQEGQVVSPDRLIDALWGESARDSANALQAVVSRVRRILAAAGSPDDLETHPGGYALRVAPERVDLARFEGLRERARRAVARGGAGEAFELLTRALALWRGDALAEFAYDDFATGDAVRLAELRLQAVEERCDAALRCGRPETVVAELQALVRTHPDRERVWLLLMLALYRSSRQAAALETYQQARAALAERAGVDPGRELRDLHGRMLQQDPALDLDPGPPPADVRPAAGCLVVLAVPGTTAPTVDVAETLAQGRRGCELLLTQTMPPGERAALAAANDRLEALAQARTVPVRVAAFTSRDPAADIASLAEDERADVVVAPLATGGVLDLLRAASCHVALVAGDDVGSRPGRVAVPFGGTSHDWAALELATWLGHAGGRVLLVGIEDDARSGRDASRLLAIASLAAQRVAGLRVETMLAADDGQALHRAVADATVVAGISERWRSEGVGAERLRLADRPSGLTVIVRGGTSSGSLTVRDSLTQHPWSHPPS